MKGAYKTYNIDKTDNTDNIDNADNTGEIDVWYVIQTFGGQEERTADMIRRCVPSYYIEDCFVPKRERMKKFHGCWNRVEEVLFHGYVFVISEQPQDLYKRLRQVPKLTKVLGREDNYFIPLSEAEKKMVQGLGNEAHKTSISKIELEEGKTVQVIEGPLKDYVGNVVKLNLHKREVVVSVEFMGRDLELKMGIEMLNSNQR